MLLPLRLPLDQMQTRWKSLIDPVLSNPMNAIYTIDNIQLKTGVNVINHLLGKTQQGWTITDIQGPAFVYRTAPFNDLTLTLTASAAVTVSIGVF